MELDKKQPMSHTPIISICIANYNGMSVIDDCIQSVLQQIGAPEIEIIIHDDASTDESIAHIRETYPDIQLMESNKNVGFCVANNRMVSIARGKYLLLLNNDAVLYPDALITLHHAALEVVQPAIFGLPQYDFNTCELIDIGSLLDPFLNPVPNLDPQRNDVGMVMGACLWIPKVLWNELGGFPEWFGSIGEDLYLCCRARLAGYPVKAIGSSGYRHHVGQSFGGGKLTTGRLSTTFRRRALSERNKTFVMVMTFPAPFMQIILPAHLAILLIEGVVLSILLGNTALLRVIYFPVFSALFRERELLREGRKIAMQNRCVAVTDFFSMFVLLPHKLRMLLRHGLPKLI